MSKARDYWREKRRARRSWKREYQARIRREARSRGGKTGRHVGSGLPLLNFLRKAMPARDVDVDRLGRSVVKIPSVFSFIRAPADAYEVIARVLSASYQPAASQVYLDYADCQESDVCAGLVLGIVARELTREWRAHNVTRRFAGSWSNTPHVRTVMRCTGIIHHLGIKHEAPSPEEARGFETFPFLHGFTPSQFHRSSTQEKSAQELTEYFSNCFHRLSLVMSEKAKDELVELIGEVMDNAERHSDRNEWFAQAYFDERRPGSLGTCYLAIVSLGQTMAESLEKATNAPKTRERIAQLVESHKRAEKLFGLIAALTEENLLTLYALQDGVSCTDTPGAGSGTVRLIEHFQQLSKPDEGCSMMALLSGSSQILFDHRYKMRDVAGRKVIAFNRSNSLDEPPSKDNVRSLEFYFPGTMIALRFEMERSYIQGNARMIDEAIRPK